jgi:hypothetical protein
LSNQMEAELASGAAQATRNAASKAAAKRKQSDSRQPDFCTHGLLSIRRRLLRSSTPSFRDPTIVGAKRDAAQAPACRIECSGRLRAAWSGGGQIHGLVKPMSFQVY